MFPTFFVGLAYQKSGSPCKKCWGNNPKKTQMPWPWTTKRGYAGALECDTSNNLQIFPVFSLLFLLRSLDNPCLSSKYIQHVWGILPFQQGAAFHFHRGIGASQRRHWCISTQALLHFNAGISACQRRHWCIFNAGISASQRRHWCISAQALLHVNGGIGAFQWRHIGAFQKKHWCISTGAVLREWQLVASVCWIRVLDRFDWALIK